MSKPFILVDGSSYLFRAFHALPPLTTSKGQPTGAIYGVASMLKKLLADYKPEHIAVVFDTKAKTFRKELYPAYKANRAAMPDELRTQIEPLHELVRAMGFPLIAVDGVEADDVIGTLALQAEKHGLKTIISTGDKDLAQLVNKDISLINTMSNKSLDIEGVKEKFGVTPEQMIDYLALMGDSSDNIPGVPNVGPKTAAKWLGTYGSLDNLLAHQDEIKGKVGENLRASLTELALAKQLVTVKCDVPMDLSPEKLILGEEDKEKLAELCQRLEFNHWFNALKGAEKPKKTDQHYECILTQKDLERWLEILRKSHAFSFDTETDSLDVMQATLVGLSLSVESGKAAYIPLAHDYEDAPAQLDKAWVLSQLKPILENPHKTLIGQNLKFDINIMRNNGIELSGKFYDTLLESYVLSGANQRHDLDSLAMRYLDHKTISFEELAGKGAKQVSINQIDIEKVTEYAGEDADLTLQIHQQLFAKIEDDAALKKVFNDIEMPLMPVLAKMEFDGILVDANLLKAQSKVLGDRLKELEEEIYKKAGMEFNIASPAQLQEVLYEKLGLPILKKTPTGQPSTSEPVLQELALSYPLPELLLEYRSLSKLKSTYTDRLPEDINPKTGRVHTSFRQAVTSTGRLSSQDPNLQNIPIKTAAGRQIRQAFIAPPGYQLVSADYSQIELRIMADLSKDRALLQAFEQGLDVHRATAAEVFGVPVDEVTSEQRRSAKTINFGLLYGMSAFGLARQLGTDRKNAQDYMDIYFKRYPGVLAYMENVRKEAAKKGYVTTAYGRKLYIPEINSKNAMMRKGAERAAINAPLQGTAADVIKLAMIRVDQWLRESKLDARMLLQVHDELVFEVADSSVELLKIKVTELMTQAIHLSVPLLVDVGVGPNWDEAH